MDSDSSSERDDPRVVGVGGQELYVVIRKAIEDAMLNVIGTILLVGIALLFVWVGARVLVTGPDPWGAVIGVGVILVGFTLAGRTLGVIPPVRELV